MPTQPAPQPGDRYTARGLTVTVQMVERGTVYYLKHRADADMAAWDESVQCGLEPAGFLGNFRMSVEDFNAQVAKAQPAPQEATA